MALELVGEMTVGAAIPMLGDASTALTAAVGAELPNLQASAAAFAEVSANISASPPTAAVFAEAALEFEPPAVDANFGLDAAAEIGIEIGDLDVYAALALSIAELCATAGVSVYAGTAPAGNVALPGLVAGAPNPTVPVFVVALCCQVSVTPAVAALRTAFGVSV